MQQESKIPSMGHKNIFIRGIDKILRRDLEKHKAILARTQGELLAFREAVSYQIRRKKHFRSLVDDEKYNKDSMLKAIDMINIDIREMSDKVKLSSEAIAHHAEIVDTLSAQLEEYYAQLLSRNTHAA